MTSEPLATRAGHGGPAQPPGTDGTGYRAYVLAVLVLVYTVNFLDRQITSILAIPIKAELGLSDTQLGLMGGLAFALFYTALGIPIARLADGGSRTRIMTWALGFWSLMTAVCGFAQSFAQLFLARLGVGVGEAGGVAPAYSLICDYFPVRQRARALAVYAFGIPIGIALGMYAGGYIATVVGWRAAFWSVVIAPLFRLTVREPVRGGLDAARPQASAATLRGTFAVLARKPSFWWLSLGGATSSMAGYGLLFWMPSFLVRSYGLDLMHAARTLGALVLVAGILGIWVGGVLADRGGARNPRAYGLVPAVAFVVTVPLYVVGVLSPDLGTAIAVLFLPTALALAWLGPVTSAIQHLVPANMRTTASATFLFINNLIGLGIGTPIMGLLSDAMKARYGAEALRHAILAGAAFYLLAALCFGLAARGIARDWER